MDSEQQQGNQGDGSHMVTRGKDDQKQVNVMWPWFDLDTGLTSYMVGWLWYTTPTLTPITVVSLAIVVYSLVGICLSFKVKSKKSWPVKRGAKSGICRRQGSETTEDSGQQATTQSARIWNSGEFCDNWTNTVGWQRTNNDLPTSVTTMRLFAVAEARLAWA